MEEKNWSSEIINIFRQFKLGNSLFREYHRITRQQREDWEKSSLDPKKILLNDIRHKLADFILMQQESATKEVELESGELEIRTELLVLKIDEFKYIVEAAIQMLPDEKIREIKEGKFL
jgi:hypothetical protein